LVLLLFVFSLFMAATIRPFADWLVARGVPKGAALLLLYGVGVGSFLLVLLLAGDLLLLELNNLANRSVVEYETLHRQWQEGAAWQQTAVAMLPPPFTVATAQDAELEEMLPAVLSVTRGLTVAIGGLLLVLALSLYWSVDQHRFERLWLSLLPARRRTYARDSWRDVETAVGSYLRGQAVQSVLVALFLGMGAGLSGLAYPLLLAFFGALAAFVPLFGGLVTAVLAFALGSLQSPLVGVGLAVYTLILFWGLEWFVEPRFWQRERHSYLLTILVIIPMVEVFGIWGLIVAPPLAAALEVLIAQAYQTYVAQRATAVQLDDLETRYQRLHQKIAQTENGEGTRELQNLSQRLAELLSDSRDMGIR
jgi:predicted PurR-regulated permease PerM